jgi:hypothetical protein
MPVTAAEWYRQNSLTAALLRMSSGGEEEAAKLTDPPPCRYLIVDRVTSSPALRAYVTRLDVDRIATDERRDLYRLR